MSSTLLQTDHDIVQQTLLDENLQARPFDLQNTFAPSETNQILVQMSFKDFVVTPVVNDSIRVLKIDVVYNTIIHFCV